MKKNSYFNDLQNISTLRCQTQQTHTLVLSHNIGDSPTLSPIMQPVSSRCIHLSLSLIDLHRQLAL